MINPTNPNAQAQVKTIQEAAGNLGLRVDVLTPAGKVISTLSSRPCNNRVLPGW